MTARDWLDHVRSCASALEGLQRELTGLVCARDECLPWRAKGAAMYAAMGGTHSDPTAREAQERMGSLDERIGRVRARCDECERVVGECLRVLSDMRRELGARHADVLELYYVDCAATWSEVAWEMGVSRSTVARLRDEAYAWIEVNRELWSESPRLAHGFG